MTYGTRIARLAPHLILAHGVFALGALGLAGCNDPIVPERDMGMGIDAPFQIPDGSTPCATAADCDDHIDCTHDQCLPGVMVCGHTADHQRCDDGVFCNGAEVCDFTHGCINTVMHETCDDGNVCTLDRCIEATKMCEHDPRDLDQDGDPDFFCTGGHDCDDRDPTRSGLAPELCDDMIDNDCDGIIDEGAGTGMDSGVDAGPAGDGAVMSCGRPPYDTCDSPLAITDATNMLLHLGGASADYTVGCVGFARPDLVAQLTLTEAHDVTIRADSDTSTTVVALRSTCDDVSSELDCSNSFPGLVRRRNVQPGVYFIILQGSGDVVLDVQLDDPTPPPTNESCAAPIVIPPTGGHYTGNFVDLTNDVSLSCNPGSASDLVYEITLPTDSDLSVTLTTPDGQYMSWEVRPTCDMSSGSVRCVQGSPASATIHQLTAGTYFLLIEGPTYAEVDYTLTVDVGPPTPRVMGDLCSTAIPLTVGTPYTGSLSGAEDDLTTTCGFNYRDLVHSFTLAADSDVSITIDGGLSYLNASLRTSCSDSSSQVRCVTGAPIRSHLRALAAGDYFVVLEGARGGGYTITIDATTPPTVPMMVTGNDNCGAATVIPATGGFYSGTTVGAIDDYDPLFCGAGTPANDVAFRLDLPTRSRVTATTDGSGFDTLLYRFSNMCRSGMEVTCDDDSAGGGASQLSEVLDPGSYFYVIDGFATGFQGNYEFQVFVSPP